MGIKRIVDTSFWTDGKVDEFSPEDKYFMLYLLTNPFSTQLGIYEISIKQVAFQLGYSMDAVKVLIERFENKYGVILYSQETKEIAIKNFLRHSIVKGGAPVRDCLVKEIKKVKDKRMLFNVFSHLKEFDNLNVTVKKLIEDYESDRLRFSNEKEKEKEKEKENENDNENDNDNEVSSPDTGYDSFQPLKTTKKPEKNPDDEIKLFKDRVFLSENQISELIDEMGIVVFDIYVDRLNAWIKTKNAKVEDHAGLILKWYREDLP